MSRRFFKKHVIDFLEGGIIPGKTILIVGSHIEEAAARLRPQRCVLWDSDGTTKVLAGNKADSAQEIRAEDAFDYVIFSESLRFEENLYDRLARLKQVMHAHTKVFIVEVNPVMLRVVRVFGCLRFATPPLRRNMLHLNDLENLVSVLGFDVIDRGYRFACPFRLLGLGTALNMIVPRLPGLRQCCFGQYLVYRLHPSEQTRRPLSCSVVIPCFNEEANVAECIKRVPQMGSWREIVVVNDGSSDRTEEIVHEIAERRDDVRLVSYSPNRGKGYAVNRGWKESKGDVMMMLDCDYTTPPEEMPFFHSAMENGAEFVNGTRIIYPRERKAIGLLNRIGVLFFARLISWVTQKRITDTFCGTKVFLKRYWECFDIQEYLWGDWDLFFTAARYRMKMLELPVHYKARKFGEAKMKPIRHGCILAWKALRGLQDVR